MMYVNQNGTLYGHQPDLFEIAKLIQITEADVEIIMQKFVLWAGYFPHQSSNQERDFAIFIKYCVKDRDLKLKAAFILSLDMQQV